MTTTTNIAPHTGAANDLVLGGGREEVCKYIYVPNVWQKKGGLDTRDHWFSHDGGIIRRGNTKVTTIYG